MRQNCSGGGALFFVLACWPLRQVLATICHAKLESGLAAEDHGVLNLLHSQAKRKVGEASMRASGQVEVRSRVADRREPAMASQVLEEAAMAAVALAVAEETAAAKAIGGGSDGRLLASTRLSDTKLLEDDEEKHVEQEVERATRLAGSANQASFGSADINIPSSGKIGMPSEPQQSLKNQTLNIGLPSSRFDNKTLNNKANNPFASYSNWSNPFVNPYFNPFASNPFSASGEHWYSGVVFHVIIASIIFVIAAGVLSLFCGFEEDFEGSDSNSSEEESSDGLFGWRGKRHKAKAMKWQDLDHDGMVDAVRRPDRAKGRNCCCGLCSCMCCCSLRMYKFVAITLICTVLGGYILWQAGILQPLLAQLLLYAYIVILVVSFVVVLFWELVASLTHNLDKVTRTVGKFGDGFNFFGQPRGGSTSERFNPRY